MGLQVFMPLCANLLITNILGSFYLLKIHGNICNLDSYRYQSKIQNPSLGSDLFIPRAMVLSLLLKHFLTLWRPNNHNTVYAATSQL